MTLDTSPQLETTSPINDMFASLKARNELGLIAYLTAGYPTIDASIDSMHEAAAAGIDLLEIGVPFSDPIADGPTIQHASVRALAGGFTLTAFLDRLAQRPLPIPTLLFSYLNPLLAFGRDRLLDRSRELNISGVLIPDLPIDEAADWLDAARQRNRCLVFLVAPTSTDGRIAQIAADSDAFIYAVSSLGTTGARQGLAADLPGYLGRIRRATDKPVAVGFGISTPAQVAALRDSADAVVIGSRFITAIRNNENLTQLIQGLKKAARGDN